MKSDVKVVYDTIMQPRTGYKVCLCVFYTTCASTWGFRLMGKNSLGKSIRFDILSPRKRNKICTIRSWRTKLRWSYSRRQDLVPRLVASEPQLPHVAFGNGLKAMTHQPTQLLSRVGSGSVGICVIGLQLDFLLHSSLVPDCLVGSGLPYDSTVELGLLMCHGLKVNYLAGLHRCNTILHKYFGGPAPVKPLAWPVQRRRGGGGGKEGGRRGCC